VGDAAKHLDATPVAPDEIYDTDADVFSPNAVGGLLNPDTISRLRGRIVAGGANNQLEDPDRDAPALRAAGIVYAPDFVINAGGLIQVVDELHPRGGNPDRVEAATGRIPGRLLDILDEADRHDETTHAVARRRARLRIDAVRGARRSWLPDPPVRYT
jgi:glutamate dehydrogenase/leucine dehydrogenase